jgi:hypothetical protein
MAKWTVEIWDLMDGASLMCDGIPIAGITPGIDGDAGKRANEIARKLNAFDEVEQVIRGITGAIAMAQGALDIQDYSSVRGLLSAMDIRADAVLANAEAANV